MATPPHKTYTYKGWRFFQARPHRWILIRDRDGYRTRHDTYAGCQAFIRCHGDAPDPDAAYDATV
jgi:hypothetical protein